MWYKYVHLITELVISVQVFMQEGLVNHKLWHMWYKYALNYRTSDFSAGTGDFSVQLLDKSLKYKKKLNHNSEKLTWIVKIQKYIHLCIWLHYNASHIRVLALFSVNRDRWRASKNTHMDRLNNFDSKLTENLGGFYGM